MDLMSIGSVKQYTKALALQTQWKLKKQSGDFTGHKKSLRDYVSFTKASDLLPDADERDDKLSAIVTKAQFGKKLSQDEWDYLKEKAPELYQKLREIEREQENYEEALKRCKTKDEAQRLHMSKLGDIMTAAKNGDSSAIFRLNRMTQTMTAFTKSKEYRRLPTEAEQAIEREAERKAEQEALRQEAALREAEREAASEAAESDEETEAASESGEDTETEAAAGAGDGAKAEAAVPEGDAEDKAAAPAKPDAKVPPRKDIGAADTSRTFHTPHTADVRRAVPGMVGAAAPQQPKPAGGSAPASGGASGVPFGPRAYLDQQNTESRAHSRRKSIDAQA